jgi:hypothetical protein
MSFATLTLAAQYPVGSVFCASGPTAIVDVTNPATGKTWMDRNLGASQVATSSTDAAAYGDLYQWGRGNDGHQCRTSSATTTLSATDQPGNALFIISPTTPNDWRTVQNNLLWQGLSGINNPCPTGYRLPTETEFEAERLAWSANTSVGAINSMLKLPVMGYRDGINGNFTVVGSMGSYWTNSVSGSNFSRSIFYYNNGAYPGDSPRSHGFAIRCIKN